MKDSNSNISASQLLLSKLFRGVVLIGFVLILAGFIFYVSGLFPSTIPVSKISSYWHLSAKEYVNTTKITPKWGWVKELGSGDVQSLASLVFMSLSAPVCLIVMAVAFLRERDRVYAVLAILQSIILIISASGIVAGH